MRNSDIEIKIYNLLENLRKNNPKFYTPVKELLKFIYKDIKKDFFKEQVTLCSAKVKEMSSSTKENISTTEEYFFSEYVELPNTGILDVLIKISNDDEIYLHHLLEESKTFFIMIKEGIYSSYFLPNYIINLYSALKYYAINKETFLNSDLTTFLLTKFIPGEIDFERDHAYSIKNLLSYKKSIIDFLLSQKDIDFVKKELDFVLDEYYCSYNDAFKDEYQKYIFLYTKVEKDIKELKEKGYELNEDVISEYRKYLKINVDNSELKDEYYNFQRTLYKKSIIQYGPIFLIKNNKEEFEKRLQKAIEVPDFKIEAREMVSQMNYEFFSFLDKELEDENSFITLMDIAFDSDTFYEFDCKLRDITEASKIFKEKPKEALELVKKLDSNKYIKTINGVEMKLTDSNPNSINMFVKNPSILEREKQLYLKMETPPDFEFFTNMKEEKNYSSYSYSYSRITMRGFEERALENIRRKIRQEEEQRKKIEEEQKKQEELEQAKKHKVLGSLFKK